MAGRITNNTGKPLPYAKIVITANGQEVKSVTDKDGLYFAPDLQTGTYSISITYAGKMQTIKNVAVPALAIPARYYNFTISADSAALHIEDKSPFMTVKLDQVKKEPAVYEY